MILARITALHTALGKRGGAPRTPRPRAGETPAAEKTGARGSGPQREQPGKAAPRATSRT
jgi:hypothetical protein